MNWSLRMTNASGHIGFDKILIWRLNTAINFPEHIKVCGTATKNPDANRAGTSKRRCGFTLVELLVVIAIITVLASLILPALARARARAQGSFCLNNTRQLAVAWMLYADDHQGKLAYNLEKSAALVTAAGAPTMADNWVNNVLTWGTESDNTNAQKMVATGIGPYTRNVASIYRCPSDYVLSQQQQPLGWPFRVRSYSMNAMVGDAGSVSSSGYNNNNPDYIQFFKSTSISRPSDIFVFLDEHPDSIDDGYFINNGETKAWRDVPASYHDGAASFSFADGHSETHHWRYDTTKLPARPNVVNHSSLTELADFNWVSYRMSDERPGGTGTSSTSSGYAAGN